MKSELVPTNGAPPIPISKDLTIVGRREYCDVHIEDNSLSKRHAVIVRTDGLLIIRDLASTNGTKVNGQRVMWAALMPNDRVTLGRCKFRVYLGPDTSPSPSEKHRGRRADALSSIEARPVPTPRPTAPRPPIVHEFAPPSMEKIDSNSTGGSPPTSTDSDTDVEELDEFLIDDDEDDAFLVELD